AFRSICSRANVRWVWSRLWSFQARGPSRSIAREQESRPPERAARGSSYGRRAYELPGRLLHDSRMSKVLAPIAAGNQLPWKLDRYGEPQWLVVVEVISPISYLVRYPDGKTEILVDSE